MANENINADEAAIKSRLKAEIDRMSDANVQNIAKSESSFNDWVKRAVRRIFDAVVDTVIDSVAQWLRGVIKRRH